jgi:hypothetical protein
MEEKKEWALRPMKSAGFEHRRYGVMGRFVYGALVGGAAVYLLDPENGAERRRRLTSWWSQNRGHVTRAGEVTARRIEDLKPAAEQAKRSATETAQAAASKVRGGRQEQPGWQPPEPVKRRASGTGT